MPWSHLHEKPSRKSHISQFFAIYGVGRGYFMTGTVRAPVFGTLNSAITNFQTRFVRTVMEVLRYYWV